VLRGVRVDAMLLDIAMRDMSGIDVLQEMQRTDDRRRIPVLLLTAIADRAIKEEGLRAGAAGLVEKPLRTSQLLAALEQVAAQAAP
jgi:CheY-like chemotaxis protein